MGAAAGTPRPIRILMLHGYTQSGPLFRAKTRALEKNLLRAFPTSRTQGYAGVELVYLTGPVRIRPADIPGFTPEKYGAATAEDADVEAYGWWQAKGPDDNPVYQNLDLGLSTVATALRNQGPFDGVMGFSQGACLTSLVASLLDPGRREAFETHEKDGGIPFPPDFAREQNGSGAADTDTGPADGAGARGIVHPPLKFAVTFSGFVARNPRLYGAFYSPKIATPMLHFIGTMDTLVEESRTLALADSCVEGRGKDDKRVVFFPGGHFVPSTQQQPVGALVSFLREVLGEDRNVAEKEKAEDMKVPF